MTPGWLPVYCAFLAMPSGFLHRAMRDLVTRAKDNGLCSGTLGWSECSALPADNHSFCDGNVLPFEDADVRMGAVVGG